MYQYGKVVIDFWSDRKLKGQPLGAKFLFVYLLTCRHRNALGYYYLPKLYISNDTSMPPAEVDSYMRALVDNGFIHYDEDAEVVLIPRFLKHNRLPNANCVKAAITQLEKLPQNGLGDRFLDAISPEHIDIGEGKQEILEAVAGYMRRWGTVPERYRNGIGTVSERFPNGSDTVAEYIDIDIDIERDIDIGEREKATTPLPPEVLQFGSVKLTRAEYDKAVASLGAAEVKSLIERLDNYSHINPSRFKSYKSHYHVLLNWSRREGDGKIGKKKPAPRAKPPKDLIADIVGKGS